MGPQDKPKEIMKRKMARMPVRAAEGWADQS